MIVFVKTWTGTIISIEIEPTESIIALKEKIWDQLGIPPDLMRLVFASQQLGVGRSLHDYNIQEESTIQLVSFLRGAGPGRLLIETPDETLRVEADTSNTIKNLKRAIQCQRGYTTDAQILKFEGLQLADDCTLSDYNIRYHDSTIHLTFRDSYLFFTNVHLDKIIISDIQIHISEKAIDVKSKVCLRNKLKPSDFVMAAVKHPKGSIILFQDHLPVVQQISGVGSNTVSMIGQTLHLIERSFVSKPVYVETLTLDVFTVPTSATDTIRNLYEKLARKGSVTGEISDITPDELVWNYCGIDGQIESLDCDTVISGLYYRAIVEGKQEMRLSMKLSDKYKKSLHARQQVLSLLSPEQNLVPGEMTDEQFRLAISKNSVGERRRIFGQPLLGCFNAIQLAIMGQDSMIIENIEEFIGLEEITRLAFDNLGNNRTLLHYLIRYDHHELVSKILNHPKGSSEPLSQHDLSVLVKFALIHSCSPVTVASLVASDSIDLSLAALDSPDDFHSLIEFAIKSNNNAALERLKSYVQTTAEFQLDNSIFEKLDQLSIEQIDILSPLSSRYISGRRKYAFICYNTDDRPGAEEEAVSLKAAFNRVGFQVLSHEWKSVNLLKTWLVNRITAARNRCGMVFCGVMSHGFSGNLQSSDGETGSINQLLDACTELQPDTPMMMMIQACQKVFIKPPNRHASAGASNAAEYEYGASAGPSQGSGAAASGIQTAAAGNVDASPSSSENHIALTRQHSVLLLSTVEGGLAERGAYTMALAKQICNSDGQTDIRTMHTRAVSDMQLIPGTTQVPEIRDTLNKNLIMPEARGVRGWAGRVQ